MFTADKSEILPTATNVYLKENTNLTGSFLLGGDNVIPSKVKDTIKETIDKVLVDNKEEPVLPPGGGITPPATDQVGDKIAPVITTKAHGGNVEVSEVATFLLPTATAKDETDESVNVTTTITVKGTEKTLEELKKSNLEVGSTIVITFTAKDLAGNEATPVVLTYTIVADPVDEDSQLPTPEQSTETVKSLQEFNNAMSNKNVSKVVFGYHPEDTIIISRLVDIDTNGYNLSNLKYELDSKVSGSLNLLNNSKDLSSVKSLKIQASNGKINIGENIKVIDKTSIEEFGAGSFNTKANHKGEIVISKVVEETISQKFFSLASKSLFKTEIENNLIKGSLEESSRYNVSIEGNINNVLLKASNVEFSVTQGVEYGEVLIDPGLRNLKINTSNYDNFELLYDEGAKVMDLEGLFNEPIKVVTSRPFDEAIEDGDIIKIDDYNLSVYYTADIVGSENSEDIKIDENSKKIILKSNQTRTELKNYLEKTSKYSEAFIEIYKIYGQDNLLQASYRKIDDQESKTFRGMRVLLGESESHGLFTLSQVGVEYEKPLLDNVPPTFNKIEIENKEVDLQDQQSGIKITVEASDNKEILWGIATFVSPNGQVRQAVKLTQTSDRNDIFEGNLTFDEYSQNGEWYLERVQIRDLDANYVAIRVNHVSNNWIKESVQIRNFVTKSEEIEGSDKNGLISTIIKTTNSKDKTPPEFKDITFDKEVVGLHEKLIMTISAKDIESGLSNIAVVELETETGLTEKIELSLLYNSENVEYDIYTGEYFVNQGIEAGLKKIKSITIKDLAGNEYNKLPGNNSNLPGFTVLKETHPSDITFKSINTNLTNVQQGGTVKMSISVEETSRIGNDWTAVIAYSTPRDRKVEIYLRPVNSYKFETNFSVHKYEAIGLWKVESITIHNGYLDGQVINNLENNLDSGNFTVTGNNDFDVTPPTFTDISVIENIDENLFDIYVEAYDHESGLEKYAALKYVSADNKASLNISLKLDEKRERYITTVAKSNRLVNYDWKLTSITLYDEIGNESYTTNDSHGDKLSHGDISYKDSKIEKIYPGIKSIEIIKDNGSPNPEEQFIALIKLDKMVDDVSYLSMTIKDKSQNYLYPIFNEKNKYFEYYFHKALDDESDYVFEIENISSGHEWGTIIYNINKTHTIDKSSFQTMTY